MLHWQDIMISVSKEMNWIGAVVVKGGDEFVGKPFVQLRRAVAMKRAEA